jgi:release factor glutamine methyltransferase
MPPGSTQLDHDDVVRLLAGAGCVFAEEEAGILASSARTHADLNRMVARRVAGDPLEQVVGWAEFCGSRVEVTEGVFVPRRRTEFLVHTAAQGSTPEGVLLDLCCGSGAIGAAVARATHPQEVHAVDVDPRAIACAEVNLRAFHARLYVGDLFRPLPGSLRGRVDVLVASPPYVPTAAIAALPAEARLHEPRSALDGGPDGLSVLRRIVLSARDWLSPRGWIFLETGAAQAGLLAESARSHGLSAVVHRSEEREATVVAAHMP